MDYLEQLKADSEDRARQYALGEYKKVSVTKVMELAGAHGMSYLTALERFNRSFEAAQADPPEVPYKDHGDGGSRR